MPRFAMQPAAASAAAPPPAKRLRTGSSSGAEDIVPSAPPASLEIHNGAAASCSRVMATFDVDTLDCTVCMEPLSPPIYQCSNGHVTCNDCRSKIGDTCPSCSEAMGRSRCLAMEKFIETLRMNCKYAAYGCGHVTKFTVKAAHERCCSFKPVACTVTCCSFVAPIDEHLEHLTLSHQVPLYPSCSSGCSLTLPLIGSRSLFKLDGIPFLLRHDREGSETRIQVRSFASSAQDEFWFEMEMRSGRKRCLFECRAASLAEELEQPEFFVIPSHMYPKDGHPLLQIVLRRV